MKPVTPRELRDIGINMVNSMNRSSREAKKHAEGADTNSALKSIANCHLGLAYGMGFLFEAIASITEELQELRKQTKSK